MAAITTDEDRLGWGAPRETDAEVRQRFGIAQDSISGSRELAVQKELREKFAELAVYANSHITDGRHKALAMEHLEDALMRFGKAIFEVPR
ncbi:hypothetical protein SEA_RUDY_52 [Microbacterium phage Rudy]|nr:hypothetical protein SEA_CASEND_55 [Microbacterium phage Casend]QQO39234.1 hypothetical protein SEA_RUDY_52 [Microbacterium phage Rudy]QQO39563.1 hypothetical protein SEA_PHABIA_54 [Microbacterium phage Phabia]QWY80438.1 hypothetical protein SEA_TEEHEE_55 [Microbacterium phage Teehee]QWY80539.1 hypothetical protein SEA_QUAMMI_52 [Microbacterium phage Quammi]QXN73449.1 hypothetical protein SEA_JEHOSHAPHAT_56 [Microbacterium phage Jehoshaphat]UVG33898.1 hypothetical protein SEA_VICEROY_53 [M